jgi:DNA polymerase-1
MDLHCINASDLGRILHTVPKWVTYEHMLVANEKEKLVKDQATIPELLKDVKKYENEINWHEERTRAKNIGFGLNYGKTSMTFAEDFNIPLIEAEDMIDAYFEIYYGMFDWRQKMIKQALEKGYVTLLSGRKRRFYPVRDWLKDELSYSVWSAGKIRSEIERQAINYPVQGGAHEVFEPACLRLVRRFREEGMKARLLLSIHDGILGECPIEERPMAARCIKEEMAHTFHKGTKMEINLKVDVDFYKWCWYGEKETLVI